MFKYDVFLNTKGLFKKVLTYKITKANINLIH